MLSLVDNKEFSDLEIYFPEEEKSIYVHKAILAARCEKFSLLLK